MSFLFQARDSKSLNLYFFFLNSIMYVFLISMQLFFCFHSSYACMLACYSDNISQFYFKKVILLKFFWEGKFKIKIENLKRNLKLVECVDDLKKQPRIFMHVRRTIIKCVNWCTCCE